MTTPSYWEVAKTHLSEQDPVLAKIIANHGGELQSRGDAFTTLARSIVGQQISVKAAASVWSKYEQAVAQVVPHQTLKLTEDDLRACGFSRQKVKYLHGVAAAFVEDRLSIDAWHAWEDEEVIAELIQLPGVGRWTAEMFLMFHLLRPDVLPVGDLGLVNAFVKYYDQPKDKIMAHAAQYWAPYKSVATWYLWRSLDPEPVAY
jgi:DNA-3-methyladenine glycosylase II